jgi:transketolase
MAEIVQRQDTRRVFIDTLCELAAKDKNIVFIIPDVGFNYAEKFQRLYPDRFFNFGVTEASSTIIAAAMALSGKRPYVYSMINFVTFRVHEMVRNAICMHKANVKILGVKGSASYRFLGFSHNLLYEEEDIDFCKSVGLKYYIPQSPDEVRNIIVKSYNDEKAAYISL